MTHQVSVPRGGSAPTAERTSSTEGAPIRKLIVYTLATLVVAASVTVAAVVVSSDDAQTSTGFAQAAAGTAGAYAAQVKANAAADTAAGYSAQAQAHQAIQAREQQYVDGLNPASDVPGKVGLSGTATADGSYQANETIRMQALAPSIDGSFQANETARLQGLAASIDGSFQVNEAARMQALVNASIDGSFQVSEAARMQALVNGINPATDVPGTLSGTVTSDGSFQANETARLQSLEPSDVPERTLWVSRHR